jgi:hypothetical protein
VSSFSYGANVDRLEAESGSAARIGPDLAVTILVVAVIKKMAGN